MDEPRQPERVQTSRLRRLLRAALSLGTSALLIGCSASGSGSNAAAGADSQAPGEPLLQTRSGPIIGRSAAVGPDSDRTLQTFFGIPYAAPPLGPARWAPPAKVQSWSQPRDAGAFGADCPQPLQAGVEATHPQSEDCLTLNVWTPAADGARRPVMVWIHGGGFRAGSGRVDGARFAREGVVFVSLNYRLGALGFFAHPALDEPLANFGTQDMVAALKWVRRNITRFGGDPRNVTIFGVSAGGMAVNLLMVHPETRGLFQQAIAQSGYAAWPLRSSRYATAPRTLGMALGRQTSAETDAMALVRRAGASRTASAAELRALSPAALIDALEGFQTPIVDGTSLPSEPATLFASGRQHAVPYITGGNSYEGSVMPYSGISLTAYEAAYGADIETAKALYAEDWAVSRELGLSRLFGDERYLLSARLLGGAMLSRAPAWLYYIRFVPEVMADKLPGAVHGGDAFLLFRLGPEAAGEHEQAAIELAERMRGYWLNFARTGDPNGASEDASASGPQLLSWPGYEPGTDRWLVFDRSDSVMPVVLGAKLNFLTRRHAIRTAP
ncbi:MAG: carboxylesterase family protein [Pseudomonadota bacterium]